ncbi:hypothetical protein FGO68_gene11145 [Halteria grandinella]|uniref:Uncharacterized protein n=1 Tax=Halteria grandinella TaxID=5974 RepID=A0A8J8NJL0_HALGN|nr:hypothetical protein FGO68_gene11145 [Halteria grandinella]
MEQVSDLITRLNIPLRHPPLKEEDLKSATYILIRHAYSEYNHIAQEIETKYGEHSEEKKALKGNPEMYDPGLHAIGKMQAESNSEHVNPINFKVVFVSPMQRTLQTCIHLFKNHPNKKDIRFVVLPIIREVLETSNDIALDIDVIVEKYAPGQPITEGIHFDFSMNMLHGQPNLWQIFTLANLQKQKDLILSLKVDDSGKANHQEVILSRLVLHEPRYENHKDLYARAKVIKQFLREYITANPLNHEKQEKYGIISHSRIIATMTATGHREEDDELIDYVWFQNCEMRPYHSY